MNIFRFNRGDFFGIIIPGTFLFFHLLILTSPNSIDTIYNIKEIDWLLYPLLFIACYITGTILRLITPSLIDTASSLLNQPRIFLINIFKKEKVPNYYKSKYPYIDHFYEVHLNKSPKNSLTFWENLKKNEYDSDTGKMYGTTIINYCKTYIVSKNKELYEEVLFNEGLVRFLSGTAIALIITLILSVINNSLPPLITYTYLICLLIILFKFRKIRVKETETIFHIYENLNQT